MFCDVLVIGAGIAGHCAALEAAQSGRRVLVLTKDGPLESNTVYAQAGIAAPMGDDDSVSAHVRDTMEAGDGLCDPSVVETVVGEAADAVRALASLGVAFDRVSDGSLLRLGREGGHSARRVAHAHGDATGREIQRALGEAIAAQSGVRKVPGTFVVDLLTVDGRCVGALVRTASGELHVVWATAVVLATGGAGRLFRETTNPAVTTGDGLAMAFRAGAALADMEFMQFHPTVLYVPGAGRVLLSEAARGEGAVIRDIGGERFLDAYDSRGELAPRDVVSRAIVTHMIARGETHVLLDLTGISAERLNDRLPGVVATGRSIGIDVRARPLPVRPAAHYTIGGVRCDLEGRTGVPGLLAAGEVTSSGLHGANRLASNSLLEGVVFGRRAGRSAAAEPLRPAGPAPVIQSDGPGPRAGAVDSEDMVRSVESALWRGAGVRRDREGLLTAAALLEEWSPWVLERELPEPSGMEAQNLILLSRLLVEAALAREETRGVHWRVEFPTRDDVRFRTHAVQRLGEPLVHAPAAGGPAK